MNSKQRVNATINGIVPDRVPIGEFAVDFDTVEKIIGHETYLRAKAKSQIAFWEGRHGEVVDSYINDRIELMNKIDLDIMTFTDATWRIPAPCDEPPPRKIAEGTWEDKHGRVYKYSETTADMDICRIKKSHGDKITLWGGVAVEHIISGTTEDVRRDVRRAMQCAKPGGRFILGSSHSIAVGSKYDNFMAMLDEYHKLCDY